MAHHGVAVAPVPSWLHEVFRPTTSHLVPRFVWDLCLDSQPSRVSFALEGLLVCLSHAWCITAGPTRLATSLLLDPPLCTAPRGPHWSRLPIPETYAVDAQQLEPAQWRVQRVAVVAAVSTCLAKALIKAPVLTDESFEYVYKPNERCVAGASRDLLL